MKSWISITGNSIRDYLLPIQLEALLKHLDPLDEIITDIVARVHAEIRTNPNNRFHAGSTLVPKELKQATCHLVIEALQSRIPNLKLSDDQVRNANNARTFLKRVAMAELAIQTIKTINELTRAVEVARIRKRQATMETLMGL